MNSSHPFPSGGSWGLWRWVDELSSQDLNPGLCSLCSTEGLGNLGNERVQVGLDTCILEKEVLRKSTSQTCTRLNKIRPWWHKVPWCVEEFSRTYWKWQTSQQGHDAAYCHLPWHSHRTHELLLISTSSLLRGTSPCMFKFSCLWKTGSLQSCCLQSCNMSRLTLILFVSVSPQSQKKVFTYFLL